MNNRMSYNDVQQLKNHIRQRLQEANVQNGQMNGYANSPHRPQGGQRPPAGGRIAQANNRVAQQPTRQQQVQRKSNIQGGKPVVSTDTTPANNAAPQFEKQVAKKNVNQQGGAHFDKYDCGHKYPKMTVRQHLKDELHKERSERIDNLRYAYVMSEILSEPVCKRRRRTQRTM